MRTLVRYAFSIGTAALLAGCGGSQITFGVPAGVTQTSAITRARTVVPHIPPRKSFQVLRQFNFTDGGLPYSGLIQVDGTLYGTTFMGGRYGYGTVYNVSTTGEEKVLHSFRGGADGEFPEAGLINVKGSLYGTTSTGGGPSCAGYGCGTVYSVTMSGSETVLH
ncbi:MAG: choice-of-anchor tandem repeat GloVer-containing protein, partial [Candidatus Cybelea sp.]